MSSAAFDGRKSEPPYLTPGEQFIKDCSDDYLIEELASRGYECLRRWDGVPTEEGSYVCVQWSREGVFAEVYPLALVAKMTGHSLLYCLGPLPENKP